MKCPYQTIKVTHKPGFNSDTGKDLVESETTAFYDCIYTECPFYHPTWLNERIKHHCRRAEKEVK